MSGTAATAATPKKKATFLDVLAWCGNVSEAARSAGTNRVTAYRWRKSDPEFAAGWVRAVEAACDVLEMEARRRGVNGVKEPVHYKGVCVDYVTKYSDTLLMFLLNGNRPEKFKRRHELTGKDGGPVAVEAEVHFYLPDNSRSEKEGDGQP